LRHAEPAHGRDQAGNLVRKAGIMAVVLAGGEVRPGDSIQVIMPRGTTFPSDSDINNIPRDPDHNAITLRLLSGP
jgi:MOSC domain-containing protein YiiM